jgi:hypothetical protein
MNKLEQYAQRYAGIHSGKDPYGFVGTAKLSYNDPAADSKVLFDGSQFARKFRNHIQTIIQRKGRAVTLLDYGCGQAQHTFKRFAMFDNKTIHEFYDGMIQSYYCYDPGVRRYSMKPEKGMEFDLTCCADVMEHIPEEFVGVVLTEIANYTKKNGVIMLSISANQAKKTFSDGENLHITTKSIDWWVNAINEYIGDRSYLLVHVDDSRNGEGNNGNVWFRYHNSKHFKAFDLAGQPYTEEV